MDRREQLLTVPGAMVLGMEIGISPVVVVMGVSGSGKTTVGELLAAQLDVPFADADSFHSVEAKAKMAAGHPLNDEDRAPWLVRLAEWLRGHPKGAVLACSALKRRYRDMLRTGGVQICFLHLAGDPGVVTDRVAHRPDHYMPPSLVQSQYDTLEPLESDEFGVVHDFSDDPENIVASFLAQVRMSG
jgi:gluconokinase